MYLKIQEAPAMLTCKQEARKWVQGKRQGEEQNILQNCGQVRRAKDNCKRSCKDTANLLQRAQKGDINSIEKLIQCFKGYVFQMEKRYFIPGGDREDLIQEGFIGLYNAIKSYRENSALSFEDYVSLSIRNSVIRAVRSATQKKQMVLTQAKSIFDKSIINSSTNKHDPEEMTILSIAAEQVCSIMNSKLTDRENEILKLRVKGFSADEIAERTKTEKKTVDNVLYRARLKIKKYLAPEANVKYEFEKLNMKKELIAG